MMKTPIKTALALSLLLAFHAAPARATFPGPYWEEQCGGTITWNTTNTQRTKIVRQVVLFLDAVMTNYRFVRVPSTDRDRNISITMNAGPNPALWGLAYDFWTGDTQLLSVEVEIYINKNKHLISTVLLHELFHAVGIDHIEDRPSLMNARGRLDSLGGLKVYPADWQVLRNQNALCQL